MMPRGASGPKGSIFREFFATPLCFSRKMQCEFRIWSFLTVLPIFSAFGTSGKGFVGRWRPGLRIPASS